MRQLNTTRLIGTPAAATDFADLRLLHADPRVMATLSADGATLHRRSNPRVPRSRRSSLAVAQLRPLDLPRPREQPLRRLRRNQTRHSRRPRPDRTRLRHHRRPLAQGPRHRNLPRSTTARLRCIAPRTNRRLHPPAQPRIARRNGTLRLHLHPRHHPRQPPPRPLHPQRPRLQPKTLLTGTQSRIFS